MLYTCVARSIYYFIIAIRLVFFSTRYAVTRESRNLELSGVTVHFAEATRESDRESRGFTSARREAGGSVSPYYDTPLYSLECVPGTTEGGELPL